MRARLLLSFVLFFIYITSIAGCVSTIELASRPITIGPEWIELKSKSPMKERFDYQSIDMELAGCFTSLQSLSLSIYENEFEYLLVKPKGCFTSLYHLRNAKRIFGGTESNRESEALAQLGFTGSPYPQILFLPDGEKVIVKAELISVDGQILKLNSGGGSCPGYDRKCSFCFSASFPEDVEFSTLRLWSSKPVTVSQVRWSDHTVF